MPKASVPTVIVTFDGTRNRWLSNFYPSPITVAGVLSGIEWPTVEHYYQAMKCVDRENIERVRLARTPAQAKKLGRSLADRPVSGPGSWGYVKLDVMLTGLRAKFRQNDVLGKLLETTGNAYLVEGNDWHDNFWGGLLLLPNYQPRKSTVPRRGPEPTRQTVDAGPDRAETGIGKVWMTPRCESPDTVG